MRTNLTKHAKRLRDVNQFAKMMVDTAIGGLMSGADNAMPNKKSVGGKIGGLARAEKLFTPRIRS